MRKSFKYLLSFVICLFLLPTSITYADSRSFSIDSLDIDTTLNTSGDLKVSEVYEYNFKGDFNGITRNINFNESLGIENIEVSMIDGSSTISFKNNTSAENGTYELTTDGSYKKLKIYSKNSNRTAKFNIKYTVVGAATKYNNAGELFWKFYENSSNVDINNISLKVNFPTGNLKEAKYWGIGPSSGTSEKVNDNTFLFKISKLNNSEYLGCRIMFPPDYLQSPKKVVSENAYDRIYNEQVDNADQSKNNIENSNNTSLPPINANNSNNDENSFPFIAVLLVILIIAIAIILTSKERKAYEAELDNYRKEQPSFSSTYYESLPSDLSPVLVAYLVSKRVVIKDIIATLMDLSVRNVLSYNTSSYVEKKLFSNDKQQVDYTFKMNPKLLDTCSIHEKYLVNWLSSYGDYSSFSLKDIENQTKNRSTALDFKNKFDTWIKLVKNEADSKPFYTKIRNRSVLTNTYHNEYLKWIAFKKFLLNYGTLKNSNFTDLELWKKYLPYALALDIGSEIIEFCPQMLDDNYLYSDPLFYNMYYVNFISNDFCDDFERDLRHNTIDNSSNSSFGDGGGFTSGGDSGSCGGGGDSGAF